MKKIDPFLLEYITPLMPEYQSLIGYAIIDMENIRIWYLDVKGIKKGLMVKAP